MNKLNTVFKLQSISAEDEITAERNCRTTTLGLYSTLEKAKEVMCQEVMGDEENDWERVFGYIIEERAIDPDRPYRCFLTLRTYNAEGEFNDECLIDDDADEAFMGRKAEDIRHKVGDIVWAEYGSYLELNIVAALPPTPEWIAERMKSWHEDYPDHPFYFDSSDDCYLLYALGKDDTHSHVLSPRVFPATENIPAELVQGLKDKLQEMIEKYK